MNFQEKLFALLCNRNREWGDPVKDNLSFEKLIPIQREEWGIFWKKLREKSVNFKDKVIVDYSCGYGFDSLFMLQEGAKHVFCLEISQERLDASRELHLAYGYNNVTYIDNSKY